MDHFRAAKPKFMPGATEFVYVRRWAGGGGESLHIMEVLTGFNTKDLVAQQKQHALIYAISPDGQRIAYHRVAEWGRRNNVIVIIDRNGGVLKTVPIQEDIEIKSLAWGAAPVAHPRDAK